MSTNDITGDKIATKEVTETYRNNYVGIDWSKKAGSAAVASTTPPPAGLSPRLGRDDAAAVRDDHVPPLRRAAAQL